MEAQASKDSNSRQKTRSKVIQGTKLTEQCYRSRYQTEEVLESCSARLADSLRLHQHIPQPINSGDIVKHFAFVFTWPTLASYSIGVSWISGQGLFWIPGELQKTSDETCCPKQCSIASYILNNQQVSIFSNIPVISYNVSTSMVYRILT
jgi:hypothetical protein